MSEADYLRPCPFCCSDDLFVERDTLSIAMVLCNACGARGPYSTSVHDDEEIPGEGSARQNWNKRPSSYGAESGSWLAISKAWQVKAESLESELTALRACTALAKKDSGNG